MSQRVEKLEELVVADQARVQSNGDGKLVRQVPPGTKTNASYENRAAASTIRRFLGDTRKKSLSVNGRIKLMEMTNTLYEIATDKAHPKCIDANRLLFERAYGKPMISEEEADAISRQQGIQLVYINRPEISDIPEATPNPDPRPDFIEAEVVEDA